MNQRDSEKITNQGFIVLRERDIYPMKGSKPKYYVYASTMDQFEWHKFSGVFKTKAMRGRYMKRILESEFVIIE